MRWNNSFKYGFFHPRVKKELKGQLTPQFIEICSGSSTIYIFMPGVFLTFFVQVGRRAHVRTSDGFTGWLSLQTLDQMDIAVKVEATGKVPW